MEIAQVRPQLTIHLLYYFRCWRSILLHLTTNFNYSFIITLGRFADCTLCCFYQDDLCKWFLKDLICPHCYRNASEHFLQFNAAIPLLFPQMLNCSFWAVNFYNNCWSGEMISIIKVINKLKSTKRPWYTNEVQFIFVRKIHCNCN